MRTRKQPRQTPNVVHWAESLFIGRRNLRHASRYLDEAWARGFADDALAHAQNHARCAGIRLDNIPPEAVRLHRRRFERELEGLRSEIRIAEIAATRAKQRARIVVSLAEARAEKGGVR